MRRSLKSGHGIDQNMLRFVLDQSLDCIKILGPAGEVNYINSHGRCALEIDDFSKIEGKPWPELWPEYARPTIERALKEAQSGNGSIIEAVRPNPRGEDTCWRISVSPLLDDSGDLVGIMTISRDISEQMRLREAEQTLMLEMRHRLRNAYTVASAILMQSARGYPEAGAFAELVSERLADVALSQTQLLDAGAKNWALADLIRNLIEAHGEGATRIRYAGDAKATVDGHAAMLIALVVGELTNNSLKYGALRDGRRVSLTAAIEAGAIALRWREETQPAGGTKLRARDGGSGYAMMERMARAQRATFVHRLEDGELHAELLVRQAAQ